MARNSIADAINAGLQGFTTGRQLRQQSQDKALAEAMTLAKINEMTRKSDLLSAPAPSGYIRDPYSGKLYEDISGGDPFASHSGSGVGGTSMGNALVKSKKVGNTTYVNPEYLRQQQEQKLEFQREQQAQKPLSGDAAGKLAGARGGLRNAQEIANLLGLQEDESGKITALPGMTKKIIGAKAADFSAPAISIPGLNKVVEGTVGAFAGPDARKLDLAYSQLAENALRARTGAAATEPEITREKRRIYARLLDNPEVILDRLNQQSDFFSDIAKGIKPSEKVNRVTLPKNGGKLMTDAQGNKAYVYPDGTFREL